MDTMLIVRKLIIFSLIATLSACSSIVPNPLSINERYAKASLTLKQLRLNNTKQVKHIDYYDALLRSAKFNLEYRIKIANLALQAGQLDIAVFTMFPNLNVSGTYYNRSNDYSVAGISGEGVQTGLSSSTPRTLRTARIALSWNILDFGMGYVKSKQQSDRLLIAQEESKRQLQQLGQDVLVAYWVAYSAQRLLNDSLEFKQLIQNSKRTLAVAMRDKLIPKENLLNYQAALLDGDRKLIQLQYKYNKAMLDLKHLLYIPVDTTLVLAPPPPELFKIQNLSSIDLRKMDVVTLINHPQLRGQHYQERIARFGLRTVLLQALPGLTLNYGDNFDSNQFLLNNLWLDHSMDIAWNLLNLASLPASYRTAKAQVKYEKLKSMAMTMTALVETRYAYKQYVTLAKEYQLAHQQTSNAKAMYHLNYARKMSSVASDQQLILARIKAILAQMDEDLLLSDLSVTLGQLYLSTGVDIIPECVVYKSDHEGKTILEKQFKHHTFESFIDNQYSMIFTKKIIIKRTVKTYTQKVNVKPKSYTVVKPSIMQRVKAYTIQVAASPNFKKMENLRRRLNVKELTLAKTQYQNHNYYVLTYGKFATQKNAIETSKHLPKSLSKFTPWIRKADRLKWY